MTVNTKRLVSACSAILVFSQLASADTVLFDDFNNGDLATGGAGTVNAGFQLVSNGVAGSPSVGESSGDATITAGTGFNNSGIVSINSFSAVGQTGITATWEVTSQTATGGTNGSELLLQGNTGFRDFPTVIFKILPTSNWTFAVNDGTNSGILASGDLGGSAAVADGYNVTMNLTTTGWTLIGTGFSNNISTSGSWSVAGFDFNDMQTSLYAAAMIQNDGNSSTPAMNVNSITVSTIPEPGTFALLAACLALTSVMLRRRRD